MPDLLDLCIIRGVPTQKFTVESCLDLTSDHTPILVTMFTRILGKPKRPSLYNKRTDWYCFRDKLEDRLNLEIPLKTEADIEEAVASLTTAIQQAAWQATPYPQEQHTHEICPTLVKQKLAEKRKARKTWQLTRAPSDKLKYNKLARELKHLLHTLRNEGIQHYLSNLTPTAATDYSLWKATRKIKHPQQHIPPLRTTNTTWARTDKQKAAAFAQHLTTVFRPYPSQQTATEEKTLRHELPVPHQMALQLQKIRIHGVENIIQQKTHPSKAPGYDLIKGKILQ